MTELERALVLLGRELDFPAEPDLRSRVRERIERKRRVRRALVFAVALVVVAFGIAMAVPDARSSILRFFHIGSATVERVHTLPPARERPLAAGLGPALSRHDAEARSGVPLVLSGVKPTRYYAQPGLIATLLEYRGKPVLLAEMGGDQAALTKKFVTPRDARRARRDRLEQPLDRGRQARPDLAGGHSNVPAGVPPRRERPPLGRGRPHVPPRGRPDQGPDAATRPRNHPVRGEPSRHFVRIDKGDDCGRHRDSRRDRGRGGLAGGTARNGRLRGSGGGQARAALRRRSPPRD